MQGSNSLKKRWFSKRDQLIEILSNPKKIIEGKTLEDASIEYLKVKASEIKLSKVQEYTRQFKRKSIIIKVAKS